ncbi:proton-coupled folate transporter-like [Patiria miniata]|uniref:Major facilitator superfamily (MFS) profile domain-containing protein n=1 Tax=Patiria miniata TaxID=46514 RepID=A0A914BE27_PATMI|nr:proton-coupled folate transporter-like [Patiria miniata]
MGPGTRSEAARTVMESLHVVTVEPIMFVLSMTNYMRTPASQLLVLHKVCIQSYNDTVCGDVDEKSAAVENDVQANAAHWNFLLKMALFIPGAIVSSLYGPLSDRLGRRMFLIIPSLGSILGAVSFLFQTYFPMMPLDYLIASEIAVGLSGNVVTAYIIAKSYLCDVTDGTNRTKRLGVMKAMSHIGGPIGAFLSGVLIDMKGFAPVYFILAGIHVLVVLYVVFWLEETVDYESDQELSSGGDEDDTSEDEERAEDEEIETKGKEEPQAGQEKVEKEGEADDGKRERFWGETRDSIRQSFREVWKSLRSMLLVCFRERLGCRRKYLLLAMLIGIIHNICSTAEMDLIVLYTKHSPLNWTATTIGVFISVRTALKAATLVLGLPAIFKIVKNHSMQLDLGLTSIGIISTSAALTMIAFAKSTTVMMIAAAVGMLVSFPSVTITSIKSKLVEPQEYGSLFAVTALIQTLTSVASSGLFNNLYAALLPIWPGLPFLVTVGFYALSLLLVLYIWYDVKVQSKEEELMTDRHGPKYKELKNIEDGKTD